MACAACGCTCSAGGEAPRDELKAPLLVDIETGPSPITATPADSEVDNGMEKGSMIVTSIARVRIYGCTSAGELTYKKSTPVFDLYLYTSSRLDRACHQIPAINALAP